LKSVCIIYTGIVKIFMGVLLRATHHVLSFHVGINLKTIMRRWNDEENM